MLLRIAFFLILPMALMACHQHNMDDLAFFIEEIKSHPPTGISPVPAPEEVAGFVYIAAGRRSPFVPQAHFSTVAEVDVGTSIRPDANRPREELENYALEALLMVGTLEQKGAIWALVQTTDGAVHRVANGNYMGQQHGRIISISEDKINLLELIQTGEGFQEQAAVLSLHSKALSGKTGAR